MQSGHAAGARSRTCFTSTSKTSTGSSDTSIWEQFQVTPMSASSDTRPSCSSPPCSPASLCCALLSSSAQTDCQLPNRATFGTPVISPGHPSPFLRLRPPCWRLIGELGAAFNALLFEKRMFSGFIFTYVFYILLFYATKLYCFVFITSQLCSSILSPLSIYAYIYMCVYIFPCHSLIDPFLLKN